MKRFLLVCIAFIVFFSCNINNTREIEKLAWLIGTWENITSERELYEIWTRTNDSLFSGKSFMVINYDTVFNESIRIKQIGEGLYYIPTVSNQNEGESIPFKLISSENGEFIFENKNHNFPQRIAYRNPKPDSLYAYIEGEEKGQYHKMEFFMRRSSLDF